MPHIDPDEMALRLLRAVAEQDRPAQYRALEPCEDADQAAELIHSLCAIILNDWMDAGRDPLRVIYELDRRRRDLAG